MSGRLPTNGARFDIGPPRKRYRRRRRKLYGDDRPRRRRNARERLLNRAHYVLWDAVESAVEKYMIIAFGKRAALKVLEGITAQPGGYRIRVPMLLGMFALTPPKSDWAAAIEKFQRHRRK